MKQKQSTKRQYAAVQLTIEQFPIQIFTIEEINLMCIYDIRSRSSLIQDLKAAIAVFYDGELIEIAQNALNKLLKMSDSEFSALEFYPIYDDYEYGYDYDSGDDYENGELDYK